jgi:methionyl-tRNA synthetase
VPHGQIQALYLMTTDNSEPATPPGPAAPVPPVGVALISIDHFAAVELRVAEITQAEAVPKSKKLLKLQITLGESLGSRQILSGISQFYTPEQLIGRRIVVVSNLQPATLMGLPSEGMLLAGSSDDGAILELIDPGSRLPLGSRIR